MRSFVNFFGVANKYNTEEQSPSDECKVGIINTE